MCFTNTMYRLVPLPQGSGMVARRDLTNVLIKT